MNQTTFVDPSSTVPAAGGGNTGNGTMSTPVVSSATLTENFTITCTVPGGSGVGQFSVTGSVSGLIGTATSNAEFVDINQKVRFTLTAGATPWAVGDQFTFSSTAGSTLNKTNFDALATEIATRGKYTTTFTTASLAAGASDSRNITHGLGTDNVKVEIMGKGGDSVYVGFWRAIARRPDGNLRCFSGNQSATFSVSPPSAPSAGDIRIVTLNDAIDSAAQTVTLTVTVTREDEF